MDLDAKTPFVIASVDPTISIPRPAISEELVVWSQVVPGQLSKLRAYNLRTHVTIDIADSPWRDVDYAVAGTSVVWTAPQLTLTDTATGVTTTLDSRASISPRISGNTVLWSSRNPGDDAGWHLYGLKLPGGKPVPLISARGNQTNPAIVSDRLIWQDDASGAGRILQVDRADAFSGGASPAVLPSNLSPQQGIDTISPAAGYTNPVYKGIHVANGSGGWYFNGQPCTSNSCPVVDALGAPLEPFFGSFVVISYDLYDGQQYRSTGRAAPWGPYVKDAMRNLQLTKGKRVVVRT